MFQAFMPIRVDNLLSLSRIIIATLHLLNMYRNLITNELLSLRKYMEYFIIII